MTIIDYCVIDKVAHSPSVLVIGGVQSSIYFSAFLSVIKAIRSRSETLSLEVDKCPLIIEVVVNISNTTPIPIYEYLSVKSLSKHENLEQID